MLTTSILGLRAPSRELPSRILISIAGLLLAFCFSLGQGCGSKSINGKEVALTSSGPDGASGTGWKFIAEPRVSDAIKRVSPALADGTRVRIVGEPVTSIDKPTSDWKFVNIQVLTGPLAGRSGYVHLNAVSGAATKAKGQPKAHEFSDQQIAEMGNALSEAVRQAVDKAVTDKDKQIALDEASRVLAVAQGVGYSPEQMDRIRKKALGGADAAMFRIVMTRTTTQTDEDKRQNEFMKELRVELVSLLGITEEPPSNPATNSP